MAGEPAWPVASEILMARAITSFGIAISARLCTCNVGRMARVIGRMPSTAISCTAHAAMARALLQGSGPIKPERDGIQGPFGEDRGRGARCPAAVHHIGAGGIGARAVSRAAGPPSGTGPWVWYGSGSPRA